MNEELWDTFIDLILVPVLVYGAVAWVSILGALT